MDRPMPTGKGRGVTQWEFFAGLCAQVVKVTYRPDQSIKIDKVIAVINLGEVVNPDNVRAQVEGAKAVLYHALFVRRGVGPLPKRIFSILCSVIQRR